MTVRRAIVLLVCCLAVAGCGSPKFDASMPETSKASITRLTLGLNEAQKKQFVGDMATVTMPAMFKSAFERKGTPASDTPHDMFKALDGMTALEIHAKAEEIRAGMKKAGQR